MTKTTVIFPFSADPMTVGHVNIVDRIVKMFPNGDIRIVIANNQDKKHTFNLEGRISIVSASLQHIKDKIQIVPFTGILTDYINEHNVDIVVRGIRNYTDFNYEQVLEQFIRLTSKAEVIYLTPFTEHMNTSSSLVRMCIQSKNLDKARTYMTYGGYEAMCALLAG